MMLETIYNEISPTGELNAMKIFVLHSQRFCDII